MLYDHSLSLTNETQGVGVSRNSIVPLIAARTPCFHLNTNTIKTVGKVICDTNWDVLV